MPFTREQYREWQRVQSANPEWRQRRREADRKYRAKQTEQYRQRKAENSRAHYWRNKGRKPRKRAPRRRELELPKIGYELKRIGADASWVRSAQLIKQLRSLLRRLAASTSPDGESRPDRTSPIT